MEDRVEPCQFCDELSGGSRNEFARRYGHGKSRVWLRSTSFVVQPSLGALAEGHSLILPVRHALSMGQLRVDEQGELDHAMAAVDEALSARYAKPIWFEHGCVDEE